MASQITLPFWPTSLDCLSWSEENVIAVGSGDQIGILTPRLGEPGPNGIPWNSTTLKVNAFTAEEVPLSEPLSFKNFSAGEELSLRHVQALKWSSPGLARYGRSVLGVLSSNHILSIWECDGKTDVARNWKRSVIINHALKVHYRDEKSNANGSEQDLAERSQVSQRVRAFEWSSPSHRISDPGEAKSASCVDNLQFMAVSTESEDIVLLRILSPYNILHPEITTWQVEVLHRFSSRYVFFKALSNNPTEAGYDSNGAMTRQMIADHLAWGPWEYEKNSGICAPFAFLCNGRLFSLDVVCHLSEKLPNLALSSHNEPKHLIHSRSDITGPLRFVPKTCLLTAFAADRIFCVETSLKPIDKSSFTFHHLDDRWDEISGVSFCANSAFPPLVHITSHLSSATARTAVLSLPLNENEESSTTLWQEAINASKTTFSAQYDLEGHVQERTWGIAASPMGDYIATATTMLPSDAVAYVTPADHRTILNITREVMPDHGNILPVNGGILHPRDVTAEVLLFGLQQFLDSRPTVVDADKLVQSMTKTMDLTINQSYPGDENAISYSGLGIVQMIRLLRTRVVMRPDMRHERIKFLANIALGQASTAIQVPKLLIQRLVMEVLQLANQSNQGGELSEKIRKVYALLNSKLFPNQRPTGDLVDADGWHEECNMCSTHIPFESLKWAKCGSGHQFSRCGLTFLAVQEPGLSKHCAVCKMKVFNEWKLPGFLLPKTKEDIEMTDLPTSEEVQAQGGITQGDEPSGDQRSSEMGWVRVSHNKASTEPSTSLARTIFAAFDTCVYCGGRRVTARLLEGGAYLCRREVANKVQLPMDSYLLADDDTIRLSNSPRRSPQINDVSSPVRSVYPQMQQMDSMSNPPDFGLRTTDFFEDSSGDESAHGIAPDSVAPDVDLIERRGSATKRKKHTVSTAEPFASQCESKQTRATPVHEGYQRLKTYEQKGAPDTVSSSLNGSVDSVDELLPNVQHSSPPQLLRASHIQSRRAPRSSAHIERSDNRKSAAPSMRVDPTLGAYAIAYEITVNALKRDTDALDRSLQSFANAPLESPDHHLQVPQELDPRSPRAQGFSPPSSTKKSVHVVPPPIDTSAPRRSIPEDIVRTPYPFSPPENAHRKDFGQRSSPPAVNTPISNSESILTLSIRRSNPNSKTRVTSLTIPAMNDFSAVRSSSLGAKERHFRALDFDDAKFFQQLRRCYRDLSGPMRYLSARSLKRIAVSGPATKAADVGYGWRSPRVLAYKGLSDTFSEEQILQHYRRPALGKARFAFVYWAHRLSAINPVRTPQGESSAAEKANRSSLHWVEQPEGLEFVVSWSVARILIALLAIIALSIAVALLWTFLGHNTVGSWPPEGGFRDSGDRLATGFLIGIGMLLLGLSSMAGWLGASWLLM